MVFHNCIWPYQSFTDKHLWKLTPIPELPLHSHDQVRLHGLSESMQHSSLNIGMLKLLEANHSKELSFSREGVSLVKFSTIHLLFTMRS